MATARADRQKFAHHCYYCKTAIVEDRFITLNDETLGERYYHELHFFCSECGDPFLDPSKSSAPGTERSAHDDVGETNPFVIHKGHPYCERCHIRLHKPKCKACKKPIPDVAVDALGAKWHQGCFVCSVRGVTPTSAKRRTAPSLSPTIASFQTTESRFALIATSRPCSLVIKYQ